LEKGVLIGAFLISEKQVVKFAVTDFEVCKAC